MSRIARKDINSSYIHVITQGINKENIFKEAEYKKEYIKLIESKRIQNHFNVLLYYG